MSDQELSEVELTLAKKQARDDEKKTRAFALDPEEKKHCQNVCVFGPSYLVALGWKNNDIVRFLERQDVRFEIANLQGQYTDREVIQERTQFFAQMKLNTFVPTALTILAKALAGTVIDGNGVIKNRPPERVQMDAAMQVLDRCNIQGIKFKGSEKAVSFELNEIDGSDVKAAKTRLTPAQRDTLRKMMNKIKGQSKAAKKIETRDNPVTEQGTDE